MTSLRNTYLRIILPLILLLIAMGSVQAQTMQIFAKDSVWRYLQIRDGVRLSHERDTVGVMHAKFYASEGLQDFPVADIDSIVVKERDIPCLHLSFPDYPDVSMIWEKELYLDSWLNVNGNGSVEDVDSLQLQVKGRGNSTWEFDKKPMRLKFSKKISLLGLPKAKNFVLLANYIDPSHLRNSAMMWLAQRLGIRFSPTSQPCNVYINGKNIGLYLLTQKVGINSASIDIDETKGVLLELSKEYDEKYKFTSRIDKSPVMVKDPDFDEVFTDYLYTPAMALEAWEKDYNRAEQYVIYGKPFNFFDKESVVSYLLLYNLTCNDEIGHPKSLYMWKEALGDTCKYIVGPAWDFDHSFECDIDKEVWLPGIFRRMVLRSEFMEAYKEKLQQFYDNDYYEFRDFLYSETERILPSARQDGEIWPIEGQFIGWATRRPSTDPEGERDKMLDWIEARIQHLLKVAEEGRFR